MGSGRVAKDYYLPKTLKTLIITDEPELSFGQIFDCTSIVDVIMSKSITKIDNSFRYNTNMEHFYYEGSKSEWEQVNRVAPGCGTVYYYSETEPSETGNYWRYNDGVPTIWVIE